MLARTIASQLARPTGSAGHWLGKVMDLANRRPTRLALDMLAPAPGESVLDAGCGTGAAMAEALDRAACRMVGIDPSGTMLNAAHRRLSGEGYRHRRELHCASIEDMPFADASFDAALALNVLYFCDADCRMIDRLRRVLKPGGRIVAYVTHRDTMQDWPFAAQGFHRLFDARELVRASEDGGFASERIAVHEVAITRSVRGLLAVARR